jgi:hypothetical protein
VEQQTDKVTLTDENLRGALAELTSERNKVTSRILGGA